MRRVHSWGVEVREGGERLSEEVSGRGGEPQQEAGPRRRGSEGAA